MRTTSKKVQEGDLPRVCEVSITKGKKPQDAANRVLEPGEP